ncbi:MAG TPA: TIGR02677 family protein [Clostridiales bacterium]|nr:TIGR02677 family protein [Clostridiales bacterium]
MPLDRRSPLEEMPEANYLVGHQDGPYYRLIVRFFYERHRAHANYVRSDEIAAHLHRVFPEYDETACRRHLDQLERWRLVRVLPEQSRPRNLLELRLRPRTYQAERLTLKLEELRVKEEAAGSAAASLNPSALDQLAERLEELVEGVAGEPEKDEQHTYELWHTTWRAFDGFARDVEAYLADLPRHKPRETLDYLGFMGYRELVTGYLSDYARRLFERKEYLRHLLRVLPPLVDQLAGRLAAVESRQVRADGSTPELDAERDRYQGDLAALRAYFAEDGDAEILLERAQTWVAEVTRHARRLSEQHRGGTVREQTLLELGRRFACLADGAEAHGLAQVAFGATLPLHWKGAAPPSQGAAAWGIPPIKVPLQPVRRGQRQRLPADATVDRTVQQFERMLAESRQRERTARDLAALFGPDKALNLGQLEVPEPRHRQQLLHLFYQALSRGGAASMGYRNWQVTVEEGDGELGELRAPDGTLSLPGRVLRLHTGGEGHG